MYIFMGNDDGTSVLDWEGVSQWANFILILGRVIITENAIQVSRFDAVCEV